MTTFDANSFANEGTKSKKHENMYILKTSNPLQVFS